jgi:hypothetical protein
MEKLTGFARRVGLLRIIACVLVLALFCTGVAGAVPALQAVAPLPPHRCPGAQVLRMRTFPPVANGGDYRGEYPFWPGFVLTVWDQGQRLYVRATDQPRFELEAAGPDIFVVDGVGAELTFERDRKGRVDAVTLRQAGQRLRAPRR